jgi:hypothetical protein
MAAPVCENLPHLLPHPKLPWQTRLSPHPTVLLQLRFASAPSLGSGVCKYFKHWLSCWRSRALNV